MAQMTWSLPESAYVPLPPHPAHICPSHPAYTATRDCFPACKPLLLLSPLPKTPLSLSFRGHTG